MSNVEVELLAEADRRPAYDLTRAAQHAPPVSDTEWATARSLYEPGLGLGAFLDGRLVGSTNLLPSELALPGGVTLPMCAATGSGVRADFTRRGVFTSLKRARLDLADQQGFPVLGNIVSEATIYGRYGHGVGTMSRAVRLSPREARLRPDVPVEGDVRLLDLESAIRLVPDIYAGLGPYRPGVIGRSAAWWTAKWERSLRSGKNVQVAVHSGAGDDGFAAYAPVQNGEPGAAVTLMVSDFHARGPAAAIGLWRFLLGLDLVDEVLARRRPTDELVEGMLTNWRACRTHSINDDLWIRLVDVPVALDARPYGDGDPVVLEVVDGFLPANSGRYEISPDGVKATSEPAALALDADVLAMAYLGTRTLSALAAAGRVRVTDAGALPHADRLFGTATVPFCGTVF